MPLKRTQPCAQLDDPFLPGVYLTDGTSLFNIVGALPHEPSLRLVEDCGTLEILMVHVDGLRAPGVRRVDAMPAQEIDAQETTGLAAEDVSTDPREEVAHTQL
jgi:hypothetical protein